MAITMAQEVAIPQDSAMGWEMAAHQFQDLAMKLYMLGLT